MKKITAFLFSRDFVFQALASKALHRVVRIILFLIIFSNFSSYAIADIREKQDISKTVQKSDIIIRGKVISTESQWKEDSRGRHIYTSVNVKVLDKIKGNIKDGTFAFEVVGGIIDDIGEVVSDTPAFETDEDAIIFLSGQPLTVKQGINSKISIYNGRVYRNNSEITVDSFIQDLKILEQDPNAPVSFLETDQEPMVELNSAQCFIDSGLKWPGALPTVSYKINENTSDCTGEGAAVQAAASSWNNVVANFTLSYGGSHTSTVANQNYVNEIMWGTTSGSIATTTTWYYESIGEIIECDIVFNDTEYNWSSTTPGPSQMDVQSVGLHELGHWLKLDDLYNSEDSGNVMYGYGDFGEVKRTLQPCDISGICYIYGGCVTSYTLSVNSSGASGVSISSSTGHNGITNYTKTVSEGATVSLTAPSTSSGQIFTGWTGSVTSSNQTISFSMNGTKTVTANYIPIPPAATLVFTPDGGSYSSKQNVTITCDTPGATICYTTDGNDPTESDPIIASGSSVLVGHTLMLKAKAWKEGLEPSDIMMADYQIELPCPEADLTGDCIVNFKDFASLANWWLSFCDASNGWCEASDFDLSGDTGIKDVAVLTDQWLDEGSYTLYVNSSGASGVSIDSNTDHDGITNYTQMLTVGTSVSLTAPATVGDSPFTGWTGDVNSSNQTISFLMDADKTVTANYAPTTTIDWVDINDPGVSGHEGFSGQMSKYETTNAQYCQFLNAALATGDITVSGNTVYGANGSNSGADFVGEVYYDLAGAGETYDGATNGGASRINYTGGVFSVDSGFENHPVTYVSWYGATAFCNYYGYRLPTEWEWQAVADYDGSYTYGCGLSINNSIANYGGSTHPYGTTVVGAFGTYGYGMCDMAGNAWEWTSSLLGDPRYDNRVLRGGNWNSGSAVWCKVSFQYYFYDSYMNYVTGFRVCR